MIETNGRIWLTLDGKPLLGKGRYDLLLHIDRTGSISKAAKSMRMSYKAAWDAVDAINKALGAPVVESATGGAQGGGSQLTAVGHALTDAYSRLQDSHQVWLSSQTLDLSDILEAS